MNFDFSEDVMTMRSEVHRVLQDRYPATAVRQSVDAAEPIDRNFWQSLGEMGWLGVALPEAFGGIGMGYEPLCMIAEELGRTLANVPFASSIFLAAEAIAQFGSDEQKNIWLPRLASGEIIGCFALAEGLGEPSAQSIGTEAVSNALTGTKLPVIDGGIADIAIVVAREETDATLWLVDLEGPGITRTPVSMIDAVRHGVRLDLVGARGELLAKARGWAAIERLLDRAAVLVAFEQVGGAQASLDMAVAHAQNRYAFGRPIGSFQAIKHKLADVYVAIELARSNAYFGAWALESGELELPSAAAAARLSAIDAFTLAAKENIQTHGGMGFTWESDCHLYYRRARELAVELGSSRYWRDRLINTLSAQESA